MKLNLRDYINGVSFEELEQNTGIPIGTLKRIAYGESNPTISTLIPICEYLNISLDSLVYKANTDDEQLLLKAFRHCSDNDKNIMLMLANTKATKTFNDIKASKHKINIMTPTSNDNDGIAVSTCIMEEIEVSNPKAYIGYRIMNNNFLDYQIIKGDIVLLEYKNAQIGEIGVFNDGRNAFMRKLDYDTLNGKYVLKALNRVGRDLIIDDFREWTCVGVVIDKI